MDQSQQGEYPERDGEQAYGLHHCATHPDVETGLGCGRCGKYICPRCMIQTPVGARCDECASVTRHPTFDVTPSYYLRAVVAGVVVAFVTGIIWGLLLGLGLPLLILSGVAVGYVVGEAVSRASNRKRGQGLAITAGLSMSIAVLASFVGAGVFLVTSVFGLLTVVLAFYVAIIRVR